MVCYHPLHGWRSRSGRNPVTGAWPITFKFNDGYVDLPVDVPCGQCIGCRLEKSRQWAIRMTHEASLYEHNCFLTLTYDNYHIDPSGSLNLKDIQLFMKRLRKKYGNNIRFFQCGEYGEHFERPHHHVILFNHDFKDKKFLKRTVAGGYPLYVSEELSKLWPFGYHAIAEVNFLTTAYTARYMLKKIYGKEAEEHYHGRKPEFITMSRRPGIGFGWFQKYYNDVYPHDFVVIRNGIKCRPPSYYDKMFDIVNPDENNINIKKIKYKRKIKALNNPDCNNDWRLLVKENVRRLKSKKLLRPLL